MEKIWEKNYPSGVPKEINPERYSSLAQLVDEACTRFADLPAFTNMGFSMSYRELHEKSTQFAAYLQNSLQLKKGDRIAIQMPNLIQYPVVLFGALRAGLVVVNTNPLYTPREMKHQFRDSGAKAIVIVDNFADKLQEILAETEIRHVIITRIGDMFPTPKRQLVNLVIKHVKKMVPPYSLKHTPLREALALGAGLKFTAPTLMPSDTAFLQYTGGTTGVSKGAILTHRNIVANMEQISAWMKPRLYEGKETVMTPLPLYHIFSLTVNCLAFAKVGANSILVTNPRDIPAFIKEIEKTRPTALTVVNTLAGALLNDKRFHELKLDHLKITVAGGMALQTPVAKKWMEVTKTLIAEGYGLTETSPVASCNPIDGSARMGTIGIPLPSTEMKVISEDGRDLPVGEAGELCIRGPQVMKGYWNQPEETAKVMTSDGWLKTGDIAVMDSDGYFKIVDRKKDMILVSGFNVYPNEIEDVAAQHPKVLESAAIGIEDERAGEVVKLFVVARDPSVTEAELTEFFRGQLTQYKVPKQIEFRKELPKNNVGKILRRELRTPKNK